MKDFATALYGKVRSSPKTRFQRTWQEAQTWSQSNRTGCQEQLYVPFTSMGKTKPYKYAHHTLSGKKDYTTGKTTRIHSEKSRRLKRTAALEAKDPNSYIPIYSPKRLGRMGRQQGERTHHPTRWCVNEPDAWFSSQRTVVRANKKQAYLNGVVGVRKLRVRYRKTTLLCAYLYEKKEGTSRQILS